MPEVMPDYQPCPGCESTGPMKIKCYKDERKRSAVYIFCPECTEYGVSRGKTFAKNMKAAETEWNDLERG